MRFLRRLLSRFIGRRPYVVRVSDPDEYADLCNVLILMPLGRFTDGPGEIGRPAWMESPGIRLEYVPPSADELAEALWEEP